MGGHGDWDPERWVAGPSVGKCGGEVTLARDPGATDAPSPAGVNLQRKQAANFTAAGQPRREEAVSALCWGAGGETQVSGRFGRSRSEGLGYGSLALVLILPSSARRSWWGAPTRQ